MATTRPPLRCIKRILKIGNSMAVIIPPDFAKRLCVLARDYVILQSDEYTVQIKKLQEDPEWKNRQTKQLEFR